MFEESPKQLTEKNEWRREGSHNGRITALLHYSENNWHSETTQDCGESPHAHIRNVIGRVTIPNIFETEIAVKANKPSRKAEKEFSKGGMDVKVIFP